MAELILVGALVGAATSVVSGVAQHQQGRAAATAATQRASFERELADQEVGFQKSLGEQNARSILESSRAEEVRLRRDRARRLGSLRTRLASQGTTMAGNPIEVLADRATEDEEDALLVRAGGEISARQELLRSAVLQRQARIGGITSTFSGQLTANVARARGAAGLLGGALQGAGQTAGGIGEFKS